MTTTTKGVWLLNDVKDNIVVDEWINYNHDIDPLGLWVFGWNLHGQLGMGDVVHRSSPVQLQGTWKTIFGGLQHVSGIKSDDTLWVWVMVLMED
jgi:hypothetical protein